MAYVWQQGIDAGDAQPVTDCPAGEQFSVPDAPWPGLGLDDDCRAWDGLWARLDDNRMPGVGKARRLERLRVQYDVYAKVAVAPTNGSTNSSTPTATGPRRRAGEAARLHRHRRPPARRSSTNLVTRSTATRRRTSVDWPSHDGHRMLLSWHVSPPWSTGRLSD